MAKTKHLDAWGRSTARDRYGAAAQDKMRPASENEPQCVEDQHGPAYANDASGWVRGMPSAESKPDFDKSKGKR